MSDASSRGLLQNSGRSSAISTNSHRRIRSASLAGTGGSPSPIYTPFAPGGPPRPDNGSKFATRAVAEAIAAVGVVPATVEATAVTGAGPTRWVSRLALVGGGLGSLLRQREAASHLKLLEEGGGGVGGSGTLRKITTPHIVTCMPSSPIACTSASPCSTSTFCIT